MHEAEIDNPMMQQSPVLQQKLAAIKGLAFDVDGTLTDGGMWWGVGGDEMKRFNYADIMGLSLLRRAGVTLALISGEDSPLVDRFAEKLMITNVDRGCRDKAAALRDFAERHALQRHEICFMGDDVNDLPAMEVAGLAAAPANARDEVIAAVRASAGFISTQPGGHGAVRQLADAMLHARGLSGYEIYRKK